MDFLKNFQLSSDSSDGESRENRFLNQDNILWQLKQSREDINICFFGDETWLRLFPSTDGNKIFTRHEGVTSFYVQDFYTVDHNVTNNLKLEAAVYGASSCRFIILHYLGLDHIGHVHGPTERPDLITKKLLEMNSVIEFILTELGDQKAPNLLLVTGDHGMANIGGHGGSSFEETHTPLMSIPFGQSFMKNIASMNSEEKDKIAQLISQEDFAPTLTALFGLKPPADSVGRLIPQLLRPFKSKKDLVSSYHKNCYNLLQKMSEPEERLIYSEKLVNLSQVDKLTLDDEVSLSKLLQDVINLEFQLSSVVRKSSKVGTDLVTKILVCTLVCIVLITISEVCVYE